MKCADVSRALPEWALGGLDAEPSRALEEHLRTCEACRAEQGRLAGAVSALRGAAPLSGSEERRESVVARMSREHADLSERRLRRRPMPWKRIGLAAGIAVLVAGAAVFFAIPRDLEITVTHVGGRGEVYQARTGRWSALASGLVLRLGDRVLTQNGATARMTFEGGSLQVDQNSSFTLAPKRALMLDRGRLHVDVRTTGAKDLVITDTANNAISLRQGKVEAGMRDVYALVAGHAVERPARDPEAAVSFEEAPFADAAAEISRRTGRPVAAAGGDVARQKITFYSRVAQGEELFDEFVRAMERQNIAITDGVARGFLPASKVDVSRRLFARVASGEALLGGAYQQQLRATAGQEGYFDLGGTPEVSSFTKADFAPWMENDYYERLARNRVQLGAALALRTGRDAKGAPLIQCRVENAECLVKIDDMEATLKLLESEIERVAVDGGEVVIPLKMKFELKK